MNGNCSVTFERMAFCTDDFTLLTPISCSFSSNLLKKKKHKFLITITLQKTTGKMKLDGGLHQVHLADEISINRLTLHSTIHSISNFANITIFLLCYTHAILVVHYMKVNTIQ